MTFVDPLPAQLRLETYAALCETLQLEVALQHVLLKLASVLPADGVFVNFFDKAELTIQFLAHATPERAERFRLRVPVSPEWLRKMSYKERLSCLVVERTEDDPLTHEVLEKALPQVRSYVMLRLLMDDTHYGVVCFYSRRPAAFNETHAAIVKSLHNPIAINVGSSLAGYFRKTGDEIGAEYKKLQDSIARKADEPLTALIRHTPSFAGLADALRRVAPYDATVMITGESGCGKEVVATTIQQLSKRRNAPFVKVNCAALPAQLIESEFFGYERGAFTGARERHAGLFEQADQGTLFLDEVGDLPPEVQVKLLRVIQGQSFRRVGGDKELTVDVRIICATNRNLAELVAEKRFREDLYYRLNVYPIRIAPLRERKEDIEPLCGYFIKLLARRYGMAMVPRMSEEALDFAMRWSWPGNVRELRNVMARAVLSGEPVIRTLDVSAQPERTAMSAQQMQTIQTMEALQRSRETVPRMEANAGSQTGVQPLCVSVSSAATDDGSTPQPFDEMQKAYFRRLLTFTRGKISGPGGAAELAGMNANTLRSRLEKLGIVLERRSVVR